MRPEQALVRALRRSTLVVVGIELARSVPALLEPAPGGRPWLDWSAFALLVGAAVAIGVLRRGERSLGRKRFVLVAVVLLASVTATAGVPQDRLLTGDHWSWFIIGWFLVAILIDDRNGVVAAAVVAHLVLVLVQVRLAGPIGDAQWALFGIRGALLTGAQVVFGFAGAVARQVADGAARFAARQDRARTGQAIAEEVLVDQRRRTEQIAATAVPLLEGISTGALSPHDPEVRRRSMVEAGRLRRLLAEGDQVGNPLTHELRACVELAERAGVRVDVAYRGVVPKPDLHVRRRLTEPIIEVLAGARSHARVTVDGNQRELVVSVLADADTPGGDTRGPEDMLPDHGGPPGDDGVEVSFVRAPGRIWVTARWQLA